MRCNPKAVEAVWRLNAAALTAILLLLLIVFPKGAAAQEEANDVSLEAATKDVWLVLVKRRNVELKVLEQQLLTAVSDAETFECKSLRLESLAPAAYETLRRLAGGEGVATVEPKERLTITPHSLGDGLWIVDLGDAFAFLHELELIGADDKQLSRLEPRPADDVTAKLRFHGPGRYVLQLSPSSVPASCRLAVEYAGADSETIQLNWPATDEFYLAVFEGVRGNEEELITDLVAQELVEPPRKVTVQPAAVTLFVTEQRTSQMQWIDAATVRVTLRLPQQQQADRAWLMFPLSLQQRGREAGALQAVRGDKQRDELLPRIRKQSVPASAPFALRPGSLPTWIEIPSENGFDFSRELKVDEVDRWTELANPPQWALVVFERSSGPILVNRRYVTEMQISGWTRNRPSSSKSP